MSKIFYDHLIDWKKVDTLLKDLDITGEERLELIQHIDDMVHSEVLGTILTHLPEEKHEDFIDRFHKAPHHDQHLDFLKNHATIEIESHIQQRGNEVISEVVAVFIQQ